MSWVGSEEEALFRRAKDASPPGLRALRARPPQRRRARAAPRWAALAAGLSLISVAAALDPDPPAPRLVAAPPGTPQHSEVAPSFEAWAALPPLEPLDPLRALPPPNPRPPQALTKGKLAPKALTDMKRLSAAAVLCCSLSLPALAEEPAPETTETRVYAKRTLLDFETVVVSGEVCRPAGSYVEARGKARFQSLLKVRGDFRPELLRSVEGL
ncbi:MAG: hypothetical protein U1E65_27485 [Myxococcota bacterium]